MKTRCEWATRSALEARYHDTEWGVPSRDDRHLFEMLVLEGAQAGLSWDTILKKRDNYRRAFAGFDPAKVARFHRPRRERLLRDPGIVRNRLKIEAAVINAKMFLAVKEEQGSFAAYIWQFVDGAPIRNAWRSLEEIPAETPQSRLLSKDLTRRGFKFVGPTICYAFMQAVGLVNDHVTGCFRYRKV
ncbi:MAG: DNA-3-methyladenine glycosylase I [Candidatus Rokuibacteriota bacterium]|nr:MAG: DNA-3-methyladenine glycosylase I [Candidatus Rokubacteria bacterium]